MSYDRRPDAESWPPAARVPRAPWPRVKEVLDGPPRWTSQAACAGLAPLHDTQFADEPTAAWRARYREARAVCRGCPVVVQCAGFADEHKLLGVWGGRVRGVGRGAVSVMYPTDHIVTHPYLTTDDPESEIPA